MAAKGSIEVRGIRELQMSLKKIDKDLANELRDGLAQAAEIVVNAARPKVPVLKGAAAASIKVRKQQRAAAIAVGGSRAPYFPWLDFGGRVGRGKSVSRPVLRGGRYIYPTLNEKEKQIRDAVDDTMRRLAEKAGFETKGDN